MRPVTKFAADFRVLILAAIDDELQVTGELGLRHHHNAFLVLCGPNLVAVISTASPAAHTTLELRLTAQTQPSICTNGLRFEERLVSLAATRKFASHTAGTIHRATPDAGMMRRDAEFTGDFGVLILAAIGDDLQLHRRINHFLVWPDSDTFVVAVLQT
jgi:hypothetical protein